MSRASPLRFRTTALALAIGVVFAGCAADEETPTQLPTALDHSGEPVAQMIVRAPAGTVQAGGTLSLTAIGLCEHQKEFPTPLIVRWVINDPLRATVDQAGVLNARRSGRVVVAATYAALSATTQIQITRYGAMLDGAGGILTALDGGAELRVPAGLLSGSSFYSLEVAEGDAMAQAHLAAGSAYEFLSDGVYPGGALVALAFDPARLPQGAEVPWLRLHRLVGNGWVEVEGGSVDEAGGWVYAPVNTLGTFAIFGAVPTISSVKLSLEASNVVLGGTQQLNAVAVDALGKERPERDIDWSSSDPGVISVTSGGLITGVAMGAAEISAFSEGAKASVVVSVVSPVNSLVIEPAELLLEVGKVGYLQAHTLDEVGARVSRPVRWSIYNLAIGYVGADGKVTAENAGTTRVKAEADGHWTTVPLTVFQSSSPTGRLSLEPRRTEAKVGDVIQYGVAYVDGAGNWLPAPAVTWWVGSPTVARIDQAGRLTVLAEGVTEVYVSTGQLTAAAEVIVKADVGGEHGEWGNNLSWPVVFAEGFGVTGLPVSQDPGVRPRSYLAASGSPYFAASNVPDYDRGGGAYYLQQTRNTWRASWVDGSSLGMQFAKVQWGDDLTGHQWNTRSVIRVEHALFAMSHPEMAGFYMAPMFGAEAAEMQGTNASVGPFVPMVYSVAPRLIIQKLDDSGVTPVAEVFNGSIAEGLSRDGPGLYTAEVNVAGKVIYGYDFNVRDVTLPAPFKKEGWWRIIFRVDELPVVDGQKVLANVLLDGCACTDDEELRFMPQLDPRGWYTWLDIFLETAEAGRNGGAG